MRIAIVGNSGSGKTMLAERVAERTGATHIELDAHYHQADWQPKDRALLRREVIEAMDEADRWIVDGNYTDTIGSIVRARADTIVLMDLPRSTVMSQVIRRTVGRAVRRTELWNGNREPLTNFYKWDPTQNIIRWAWVNHERYRRQYVEMVDSGELDHAEVVVIRSHTKADRWLHSLPTAPPNR